MLNKINLFVRRLLMFFPSRLPVGSTEFQAWMDDIIELAGPIADKRSMEFVISSTLIHADVNRVARIPKYYFVARLIKAAANQCAHYKFQEIKNSQMDEIEAKKANQPGAVTPTMESDRVSEQKQG